MKYLTPFLVFALTLLFVACAPAATPTAVSLPPTAPPAPLEPTPATNVETLETTTTAEPIRKAELPMGRTEEGAFYLGDPNAPVQMLDYSNFL